MYTNHLEHHGILGQKWGVRRGTSYPLDKSQYSAAERKANGVSAREAHAQKIAYKAAQKALAAKQKAEKAEAKKAEKERKKQEDLAREKSKLVKSKNIKKILKNADKFTDEEIRQIKNRLQLEKELKSIDPSFAEKGKAIVANMGIMSEMLGKSASIVKNGTDTYNSVAKVLNAATGSDLPIVGEKKESGPKGTVQKEQTFKNGKLVSSTTTTNDGRGNTNKVVDSYEEDQSKQSNTKVSYNYANGYRTGATFRTTDPDGTTHTDKVTYKKQNQIKSNSDSDGNTYSWRRANAAPMTSGSTFSNFDREKLRRYRS